MSPSGMTNVVLGTPGYRGDRAILAFNANWITAPNLLLVAFQTK
jgi:hypothetical protein